MTVKPPLVTSRASFWGSIVCITLESAVQSIHDVEYRL